MVRVALLAAPGVQAGSLYGAFDVLSTAGASWGVVDGKEPEPLFQTVIVGRTANTISGFGGVAVEPGTDFDHFGAADIVYVPAVAIDPAAPLDEAYAAELAFISDQHAAGALIASACSGSLLVAATGILDGSEATTHWAFASYFRKAFPAVRLREDQVFIASGEGDRILSAGGGTGWQDVVFYLIARYGSLELARQQSRMFLLQWHPDGQSPYASCMAHALEADAAIQAARAWMAKNADSENPVEKASRIARLPPRSFARRFRQATGVTPIAFVQRLRVEKAKEMIEHGATDVEALGEAVGYKDTVSFRRVFSRLVGLTPAQYRRRYALPPPLAGTSRRPAAGPGRTASQ